MSGDLAVLKAAMEQAKQAYDEAVASGADPGVVKAAKINYLEAAVAYYEAATAQAEAELTATREDLAEARALKKEALDQRRAARRERSFIIDRYQDLRDRLISAQAELAQALAE